MSTGKMIFSLGIALLLFVVGFNLTAFMPDEAERIFTELLPVHYLPREMFWSVIGVVSLLGSMLILESVINRYVNS